MKKILVITPFFYPHIGGSEQYMEGLYVYLKQKQPEIRVDVLCYNTDKAKAKERYKGLNIYRIPGFNVLPGQFALPKPLPLLRFLSTHKDYDLVHTSTRFFDSSWWAPIYARWIKARLVLTDHCAFHPTSGSFLIDLAVRMIEATIVRFSLRFYAKIFAENGQTVKFLKETFKVDSVLAYPGINIPREKYEKKKTKKLEVVFVGRMIKSKGVTTLFEIAKAIPNVNFSFAGEGKLLKEFKDTSNVSFLGNLSKEKLYKLLKTADIFAYPSKHSEGLPLALVEAGAMGLAVLTTDSGAISEIIKDGQTGILVKKNDSRAFRQALDRLLKDPNLREKLGGNLQEFTFQTFSWEKASNLVLQNLK